MTESDNDMKCFASYILPRMTMSAVEGRLGALLETDWQQEAELLQ